MDAYAVLGVAYAANPPDIRSAYKRRVRTYHLDRFPAGSSEQREATERMAAVNAAYRLVRDAPLRYHRVSTGAQPDEPWTDEEFQAALRRTQIDHAVSRGPQLTAPVDPM